MLTSTPNPPPSKDALTPSEVVLIQGRSFADPKRPIGVAIVLIALIIGGALLTYIGMGTILDAWASRSWPLTEGTIVSSRVTLEARNDSTLYGVDVQYRYKVAGQSYDGKTVWFGDGGSSAFKALAQDVVDRYPAGKAVRVAYNPANTEKAVLEPGVRVSSFVLFFAGLFVMFIGSAFLISKLPLLFQR